MELASTKLYIDFALNLFLGLSLSGQFQVKVFLISITVAWARSFSIKMVHEIFQHYAYCRIIKLIVITKLGIYTSQKTYNSKQTKHSNLKILPLNFWNKIKSFPGLNSSSSLPPTFPSLKQRSVEDCFLST